ncbi:DUF3971 domain-containing protein [Arcobacter cloacae]|uniref:DUF3971 domain-containing protein n=1 Tax=Arcobacter cloacae TaxID=1054034 RepID=A0AA94FDR0_9BACT|nr:DUF3971 domain-containing protein [Arcobacter cloacae]
MDKKLILNIENIEYSSKKSESKSSFENIKKDIELLPTVLKLFQSIEVNRLKIGEEEFKIVLNEKELYLDNKFVNLSSKIDTSSNSISFDLHSLYLKDIKLKFDGKIKIDYFNEKLNYFGNFYYEDIKSSLNLEMNKEIAKFYLVSEPFENLKFLKNFLDLPLVAEEWMYDNVEGKMKLQEFYGEYDLKNNQIIEKSLIGKATIDQAKIRFHKDVDVINTQSLNVTFKNDNLHFDLINPIFKEKNIEGSFVTIHNLTSSLNGEVEVNIKTNDKLDRDILDILKAYNINLPIIQKNGTTNASLTLLFPYDLQKDMSTKGEFLINDAEVSIGNFSFKTKNATVNLDGTKIYIKDSDFKYQEMIDAVVNLELDTKTLKSSGEAFIKNLQIKKDNNEKIVEIKDKKTLLEMDFNKNTIIDLKDLETKIEVQDNILININNLAKIYPYSKLLKEISAKNGNLNLEIKNEKEIKFNASLKGLNFPLEKNGMKIENLDIIGNIEDKNVYISSIDEDIKLQIKDDVNLTLKNLSLNIDIKNNKDSLKKDVNINLINCDLILDGTNYQLKNANIFIKNQEVNFDAVVKNLDLPLKKNGKEIKELSLVGIQKDNNTKISTKNKDLILELKNETLYLQLDGYDVFYKNKINEEGEDNSYKNVNIIGKNSNIIIDEKYKLLANNYEIRVREDEKYINLKYKDNEFTLKQSKDKKIDIYTSELSDEFVNAIFDKNIFKDGKLIFLANGSLDKLNGKIIIENSNIEDLAILNNLLVFIHTSPALINPLLAIPSVVGMATNSGFNLTAYKIINGIVEFEYTQKESLLEIKKLVTIGNGIDFEGKGRIDLNNMTINSEIKLIFLKDYSKIVGAIPVVNYVLLGDSNRVETQVNLFGDLSNPSISTNLTKETFSIPMNITKRIFSTPSMIFDFLSGKKSKEEIKNEENRINKPLE